VIVEYTSFRSRAQSWELDMLVTTRTWTCECVYAVILPSYRIVNPIASADSLLTCRLLALQHNLAYTSIIGLEEVNLVVQSICETYRKLEDFYIYIPSLRKDMKLSYSSSSRITRTPSRIFTWLFAVHTFPYHLVSQNVSCHSTAGSRPKLSQ
jgi:hypothetical protein